MAVSILAAQLMGYQEALALACDRIVELCGECPRNRLDLDDQGCDRLCEPGREAECWAEYLLGERWGDE